MSCELIHCKFAALLSLVLPGFSSDLQERCEVIETLLRKLIETLGNNQRPTSTKRLSLSGSNPDNFLDAESVAEGSFEENYVVASGDQSENSQNDAVQPVLEKLLEERKKAAMEILADIKQKQTQLFLDREATTPAVSFDSYQDLEASFERSVDDYDTFLNKVKWTSPYFPRFWLRKATWWLLKFRKIRSVFETESNWLRQAQMDLLKACWVVYKKVLGKNDIPLIEDRDLLKDLLKVYSYLSRYELPELIFNRN